MGIIRTIPRRRSYFAPGTLPALRACRGSAAEDVYKDLEDGISGILMLENPLPVASGRVGMRLLLETSGIDRGSEVLLPGYTFGLLYPAVRASGFVPVPVDIDPETFQMDAGKAEEAVTPRTGAVIATHLFGEPCDVESLLEMSRRRSLLLIEDCAQALGACRRGRPLGTFGNAGFASFDMSKPLQGIRGGLVFGKDAGWIGRIHERIGDRTVQDGFTSEIARGFLEHALVQSLLWRAAMMLFSNEGIQRAIVKLYRRGESGADSPGMAPEIGPAALPVQAAAMVALNLRTLGERLARRRAIRELYVERLGDILAFQRSEPDDTGSVHILAARAQGDLFALRRYLALRGVDIAIGAEVADDCLNLPGSVTDAVFRETIAIPVQESLTDDDVMYAARLIKNGLSGTRKLSTQYPR